MAPNLSQMGVAIVDHVGNKAGMDSYTGGLAAGLAESGCNVHVFSNFFPINQSRAVYHILFDGHTDKTRIRRMMTYVGAVFRSAIIARSNQCHHAIFHIFSADYLALILAVTLKLFGLRPVAIAHDIASFTDGDRKWIQSIIYNFLTHYVVVHNDFSRRKLLQSVVINHPQKVKIARHGAIQPKSTQNITRSDARRRLSLSESTNYLLFFGQIKSVKGLDLLIDALALVKTNIHLIIAGKPWKDDYQVYSSAIAQKGLNARIVEMIGFVEDQTRDLLFAAVDVIVLPYRRIYQSGVLLMAMSNGVAVIASDLEPNLDVIIDGVNGLLFRSEDPNDLARVIERLFSEKELAHQLRINATRTVCEEFSWDAIAKEYIAFLYGR